MMIGYARVSGGMLETHRDSYTLASLTVVSTRRPFLVPVVTLSAACCGFALSFLDLLYLNEIAALLAGSGIAMVIASQVGQLRLLSRELNGNELSGAVWGQIADLNKVRSAIAGKLDTSRMGDAP